MGAPVVGTIGSASETLGLQVHDSDCAFS
jgi:hypothetical protein